MRSKFLFPVVAGVLALSTVAHASSITGNTVTCALSSGSAYSCSTSTAVVGAGTEFTVGPSGVGAVTANFSGSSLVLGFVSNHVYTNTVIKFTDTTKAFDYAVVSSFSGLAGFVPGDVTLVGGLLSINLIGVTTQPGDTLTINLISPTPEPSALVLLGTGMLAFAGLMRRRMVQTA